MTLLTIGEAAHRLDLAVDTIRRLERDGLLKAQRTPGGHRRFREDVVEAYARWQKLSARRGHPDPSKRRSPRRVATPPVIMHAPRYGEDSSADVDESLDRTDWEDDPDEIPALWPSATAPFPPFRPGPQVEVPAMKLRAKADEQAARYRRYKAYGLSCIPYDAPASWRATVIAELEGFVTPSRFPEWVSDFEAMRIIDGHVKGILTPQREEAERAAKQAARRAEQTAEEQKRQQLVEDGMRYARANTMTGWDDTPAEEAREAVQEELEAEVKPNWSQRRVHDLVDEILAEWGDEED